MEWNSKDSLDLISLYKENDLLWNPANDDYKSKLKRLDAWNDISQLLGRDPVEVRKKMESLLTSFRRERRKEECSAGSDGGYVSTWFAYKSMMFLYGKYGLKNATNAEEVYNHEEEQKEEVTNEDGNIDEVEHMVVPATFPTRSYNYRKRKTFFRFPNPIKIRPPQTRTEAAQRDRSTIYGEYIATHHRTYSAHTRSVVEHLISDILFQADMGQYEITASYARSPTYSAPNKDHRISTPPHPGLP